MIFKFKEFEVIQTNNAQKVGTDSMILGAWSTKNISPKRILDIGTGTGVLALMSAQNYQNALLDGVEVVESNFLEAKTNFQNSKFNQRLTCHHISILEFAPKYKYDLIISNPPYFENALLSKEEARNVARHTSSLSMESVVEAITRLGGNEVNVFLVYPYSSEKKVTELMSRNGLYLKQVLRTKSSSTYNRSFMWFSKQESVLIEEELCVRNSDGTYSDAYKQLAGHFHYNKLK